MKLNGAIAVKGVFEIVHRNAEGAILDKFTVDNTVTNAGLGQISGLYNGGVTDTFGWLALDASSTAAAAADTGLASEITSPSLGRAAASASQVTTTETNDTGQLLHTFSSTATQAVNGVGVFNTSTASGGDMISRITFSSKNLVSGDTLAVTHKLIFS